MGPDVLLLGHNAIPTTHVLSFLKKNYSSTYSYPLIPLPIALIRSSTASERMAASPPRRSTRPPPRHGARPPPSRGARLPALPGARTAALSKSRGRGLPAARSADASLLRRVATIAGPPPTSTARPLHPVNTTHRRASILSSSKKMLRSKRMLQEYVLIVSDVSKVCCKCFIWM